MLDHSAVTIIGRLGKDANIVDKDNFSVANFSVCVNRSVKEGDQWTNQPNWFNVVQYSPTTFHRENLKKGAQVVIQGVLTSRNYQNNAGVTVNIVEIISQSMKISNSQSEEAAAPSQRSASPANTVATPTRGRQRRTPTTPSVSEDNFLEAAI